MDLSLSETQQMLRESARSFTASSFPTSFVRQLERDELGYSPEIWREMAELSWTAAPFPEEYGGLGTSLVDVAVVAEELAQAAALSPYVTTVLGGLAVQGAGGDAQKRRLLPGVCDGSVLLSLALVEPWGTYEPDGVQLTAAPSGDGYVLDGTKLFVEYANAADELVCVARTGSGSDPAEGVTLFLVPTDAPGVAITPLQVIGGDRQCEVTLTGVQVGADRVLGPVGEGWPTVAWLLDVARGLASVELVGFAQRALEMTLDYVGYREAFGRPIGSFQAVHHHCANMATLIEGARWAAYEAVWSVGEGLDATRLAASAKAAASNAGREVTMLAHQLHGGLGYMEEFDLQFYSRRAKGWELKWGTPDQMYLKVADGIGL